MLSKVMGRKIFFIYPHSVIQNKLIQELISCEYEVYLINDYRKIESICEYYTSPIIFINIDEGLPELEWEALIRSLTEEESTKHAGIGIVTYNDNKDLSKKYLMDIMVSCGFIKLKLGINDSTGIIIRTLEANEVKGDRKYVRAQCNFNEARLNINLNDKIKSGVIKDISSVGMAVTFDGNLDLPRNSYLPDVQLKLRGILLRVSAIVMGFRKIDGEKDVYLMMFDNKISTMNKSKIRNFINRTLHQEMEKKLSIQYV